MSKEEEAGQRFITIGLDEETYKKLLNLQYRRRIKKEKHFFNAIISDLIVEKYDFFVKKGSEE